MLFRSEFTNLDDIFNAFGDLFDLGGMFGGRGRSRRRGPRPGADLQTVVSLTLAEAAKGVSKVVRVQRAVHCKTCSGSGSKPGTSASACAMCGGRGRVVRAQGPFRIETTCPTCQGAGQMITSPCQDCRGVGKVQEAGEVPVDVPAGVDSGMRLRLRGLGESGEPGAPAGDLYVFVEVQKHNFFERDGQIGRAHV